MPMLTVGTWKSNCHWADIRSQISISNNSAFPIFFVVWYRTIGRKRTPHLPTNYLTWEKPYDSVCLSKTLLYWFADFVPNWDFSRIFFFIIKSRRRANRASKLWRSGAREGGTQRRILVRIRLRIRGSIPLTNGSGCGSRSCYLLQ